MLYKSKHIFTFGGEMIYAPTHLNKIWILIKNKSFSA